MMLDLAGFLAAAVLVCVLWIALYHRRKLAEIRELETATIGRFRRVHPGFPWPKWCRDCGAQVPHWKALRVHGDPATSACAAFGTALDSAGEPERPSWSATVLNERGNAGVDTLSDDPERPAIPPPYEA